MTRPKPTLPIIPPLPFAVDQGDARVWRAQQHTYPARLDPRDGARIVVNRDHFDTLSHRDDVPGALGVRQVKFIIAGVDTPDPQLYFANSNVHTLHYQFATEVLGVPRNVPAFNRAAYFNEDRAYIVGSIMAHDAYTAQDGQAGLFAVTFWPSDIVRFDKVAMTMRMLAHAMPFARGALAYSPAGAGQYDLYTREVAQFDRAGLRVVTTDEIFEGVSYSPLNLGVAYGRLIVVDAGGARPTARDIPIFRQLPNDLARVAGVISAAPQTPLSHVNLRAQQNAIPNAYLRDADTNDVLAPFIGQIVRIEVTADELQIRSATDQEMETHLDGLRPARAQLPIRDLSRTQIAPLSRMRYRDHVFYGAKAANIAELSRVLDLSEVPQGFAVPYAFYHAFMLHNDLYAAAQQMIEADGFARDESIRRAALKDYRKTVRAAQMPDDLRMALGQMHAQFPAGTTPRCRSSANAEDLPGFTGAGLYNSYTHREDEGHIEKSIKQVWASLWTHRAYEERAFYRIDHFNCAMGVLVHPNFDDEQANGVAITHNPYFETFDGYYINVQIGEDRVTNPEGGAVAEELMVMSNAGLQTVHPFVTMRIRESNLVAPGGAVLSARQVGQLVRMMEQIQSHFARLYNETRNPEFAMEIEFKVTDLGDLVVKQARPWVV